MSQLLFVGTIMRILAMILSSTLVVTIFLMMLANARLVPEDEDLTKEVDMETSFVLYDDEFYRDPIVVLVRAPPHIKHARRHDDEANEDDASL